MCAKAWVIYGFIRERKRGRVEEREEGRGRRKRGGGRGREAVCCSSDLCIHWLLLVYVLTGDWTCILSTSRGSSNPLSYPAGQSLDQTRLNQVILCRVLKTPMCTQASIAQLIVILCAEMLPVLFRVRGGHNAQGVGSILGRSTCRRQSINVSLFQISMEIYT